MKLNDNYYYCFGCGANGDAIDLTAKLFDLNPRQAAEKLIHDFGLDPDKPPANAIALPPPKRGLTDEQWADIAYCLRVLTDYLDLLHDWQECYKQWCEDNACHSVSAIRFSAELRQNDRRYNLESTNNIYLPGGRRVRGFVGIEPLVHPCP